MPFTTGRATFQRFYVSGDAPSMVDETFIDLLKEHRFQETAIGAPDEVEAGFVTAEHLLDTAFDYGKASFGRYALFALRIDTHKPPAELKAAYKKLNEQAAAGASPTGFASKAEKRDASELAARQINEDLAAGRFRKSKMIQVLWDLEDRQLYFAATADSATEQLVKLMRQAFALDLQPITPGSFAARYYHGLGKSRDFEDLTPTAFTKPPADNRPADDVDPNTSGGPICPWVTKSIDLKDFLGNELLMWLWRMCEVEEGVITTLAGEIYVAIVAGLDMDCAWEIGGKQTLRCDKPTSLQEADDALKTGKWPRKVGLILSDGEHSWDLALQGDTLNVSSALLPDVGDAQTPREVTEQRIQLTTTLAASIDALMHAFLRARAVRHFKTDIQEWIKSRGKVVKR